MSETRISILFVFLYNFTPLPLCNAVQKPYKERVILPIVVHLLNLSWLMVHSIDQNNC